MRRGTSLTEVLVFGFIGLLVAGTALTILQRTMRQSSRTQERLRGLHAVGMLTERMAQDLAASAAYRERGGKQLRVTIGPDGRSVELYRFDPDPAKEQPAVPVGASDVITPIHVERVTYAFDPIKGVVFRTVGGGRPQPALLNRFQSVRFALAAAGGARLLFVRMDWVPEERLGRPADERGETTRLECMLGLDGDAGFDHHPYRVLNPTSKFTL